MKSFFFVFLFIFLGHISSQAMAYELTYSCGELTEKCKEGETPKQVFWHRSCVSYYVHELGSRHLPKEGAYVDESVLDIIKASFETWNELSSVAFRMEYGGLTNIDKSEDTIDGNVISWREEAWPYASRAALALTLISFDPESGEILDSDIEFNGVERRFTIDPIDQNQGIDFQNTLTHEIGHFLGLDHSTIPEATMYGIALPGETNKRDLANDDIKGARDIYPDKKIEACSPVPDFLEKEVKEKKGCCALISSKSPTPFSFFFILISLIFLRSYKG